MKHKPYYSDYEKLPIGGSNPYWRCLYCSRSDPEINGRLAGHLKSCDYRRALEAQGCTDDHDPRERECR